MVPRPDSTASRFLIAGSATVCLDALVYSFMLQFGLPIDPSKAIGFLMGTVFAFFVNREWTFRAERHGNRQFAAFAMVYGSGILVNSTTNRILIELIGKEPTHLIVAWFFATSASASWNYLGMRQFVFTRPRDT